MGEILHARVKHADDAWSVWFGVPPNPSREESVYNEIMSIFAKWPNTACIQIEEGETLVQYRKRA